MQKNPWSVPFSKIFKSLCLMTHSSCTLLDCVHVCSNNEQSSCTQQHFSLPRETTVCPTRLAQYAKGTTFLTSQVLHPSANATNFLA